MVTTMVVTHNKAPMDPAVNNQTTTTLGGRPSKGHIVIPYAQGLGESTKHTCSKFGIQTHFKGNRALKQILVKAKDKDPKEKKSGVIYCYQCSFGLWGRVYQQNSYNPRGEVQGTPKEALPIQVHSQLKGHQ